MCIEIRSNHFKDCSLIEDLRNGRPCPLHTHFSSLVSQRPHEQIVFTPSPVMMVALYLVLENIKHVEFSWKVCELFLSGKSKFLTKHVEIRFKFAKTHSIN